MIVVRLRHIEAAGFCVRGARAKARALGIDWRRFASDGIPIEEVRHLDDLQITKMVEAAEREAGHVQR
jgi:hypothetical protein